MALTVKAKNPSTGETMEVDRNALETNPYFKGWSLVTDTASPAPPINNKINEPVSSNVLLPENQATIDNANQNTATMDSYMNRIVESYNADSANFYNKLANTAIIQAAAQAKYGRAANAQELALDQKATVKQLLDKMGLSERMPDLGTGGVIEEENKGPEAGMNNVLAEMDKLVSDYKNTYKTEKAEANQEAGVAEANVALTEAQTKLNDARIKLKDMQVLQTKEYLSLKEGIEGQIIPMSDIRRQLSSEGEKLTQEQKLDLMLTQNDYNHALVSVQIAQGNYERVMEMVKESMEVWESAQQMKMNYLSTVLGVEEKKMERYQTEIDFQRNLRLEGYALLTPAEYDSTVKNLGVTADTFSNFFYKDTNGDIYLKPSTVEWSEPYLMGGDYIQKNKKTGEIRVAINMPKDGGGSNPTIRVGNTEISETGDTFTDTVNYLKSLRDQNLLTDYAYGEQVDSLMKNREIPEEQRGEVESMVNQAMEGSMAGVPTTPQAAATMVVDSWTNEEPSLIEQLWGGIKEVTGMNYVNTSPLKKNK